MFQELLLEVALEFVFDFDRQLKKNRATCGACGKKCRSIIVARSKDIFGRDLIQLPADKCDCFQCGNPYPVSRYAPHLEKCLNMGRNARPKKNYQME